MMDCDWHKRAKDTEIKIRNFINGQYIDDAISEGQSGDVITKHSPRDGSLLYQFGAGSAEEVELAVDSALQAFLDGRWSEKSVHLRKAALQKLADLIELNKEELALYECLDVGKPISSALHVDIPYAAAILRNCAERADKLLCPSGVDGGMMSYQLRKPIGVVGAIVGWNFPLVLAALKAGPALVMGNSLVLKPSEYSSLSASRLAELAIEAGVPPGVFNVIHGAGSTVGDALAHHSKVGLLSFTGSTATGKKLMVASGQSNMKRLLLECGGKSPFIVFDDCPDDLDFIADFIVQQAFGNQGENCKAGSRLLVQSSIKDKLLAKVLKRAADIQPQDPLDMNTSFGALINADHMKKVLAHIETGIQEGGSLLLGGGRVNVETGTRSSNGYYVAPTIFDHVLPDHSIAQEEIFGPVLSVISFENEDEAIEIANNTCFGLQAYVSTQKLDRVQRLGRRLSCGNILILGSSSSAAGSVEIGGEPQRESGFGCELGMAGLMSYTVSSVVDVLT